MATIYKIVDINTDLTVGTFGDYFSARDYVDGRGDLAIDLVEVDEDGFEVEDFDEDYEPDYDYDFGFDPYMGCYTYDC